MRLNNFRLPTASLWRCAHASRERTLALHPIRYGSLRNAAAGRIRVFELNIVRCLVQGRLIDARINRAQIAQTINIISGCADVADL